MRHKPKPYDLSALAKELRESADQQERQTRKHQRAVEDRPTAPPGELTTDYAGFTWEKPRDKLDTWDPIPDVTEAAIVAKVAALRALPDIDPTAPHVPIDYSMPARQHSPRHDGWHPERRLAFLEQLAGTASVTEAARFVEMSRQSARRLYNRDPKFRRGWHAALRRAKIVLYESAFERATRGTQIPFWDRNGQLIGYRERHHDRLLVSLLKMCGPGDLAMDEDADWDDEDASGDGADEPPLLAWPIPQK